MGSPLVFDELLVLLTALLLVAELWSLGMVKQLREELGGMDGHYLLTLVFRFGIAVTIAQAITLVNAVLRLCDQTGTGDIRLVLFFIVQFMFAASFLWTVWEIHHLPRDAHPDLPATKWSEPAERISVQVNDPVATADAGIDQPDSHTALS